MAISIIGHIALALFLGLSAWFAHRELSRNGYEPVSTIVALFHRATSGKYRYTTIVENWPDLGPAKGLFSDFLVRTDSFYGGLVSPGNHAKRFSEKRPLSWILIWKTRRSLSYLKDENHIAMVGARFRPLIPFREAMIAALDEAEKVASSLLTTAYSQRHQSPIASGEQDRERYISEMAEASLRIAQFSAAAAAASAIGSLLQVLAK